MRDVEASLCFYVDRLGFTSPWRYQEDGRTHDAQTERQDCALILADQWPEKVGQGLMFRSKQGKHSETCYLVSSAKANGCALPFELMQS